MCASLWATLWATLWTPLWKKRCAVYDDIIKNAMMELVCQGYEGHRASSKPPEIQEYEGSTVARVECVKCKQKFDIVVSLTVEPEAKPKHYYIPFTIPPGF